jgi:chemotaxis protein MotA
MKTPPPTLAHDLLNKTANAFGRSTMNLVLKLIIAGGIFFFMFPILHNAGAEMFLNPDALMIIGSGTIIGLFIGFPQKRIKMALRHIKEAFQDQGDRDSLLKSILLVAMVYKKGNIREIENKIGEIKDEFFKLGMNLMINNHPIDDIHGILEREMDIRVVNYNLSQNLLKTLARLTPALGLAGTIISLIKMFDQFKSIETLTPMMAVALMSTFYGVVIANLVMLPLASKLKEKTILSESLVTMTLEGLRAISDREHPLKIEERLAGIQRIKAGQKASPMKKASWPKIQMGFK